MSSSFFSGRLFRRGESCAVYACHFKHGRDWRKYVGLTVVPSGMSVKQALADMTYYDENTGETLDPRLVQAGEAEEP